MRPGWLELIIVLVIVLVIFGGSKLKGIGGAIGENIREFKNEVKNNPDETNDFEEKEKK